MSNFRASGHIDDAPLDGSDEESTLIFHLRVEHKGPLGTAWDEADQDSGFRWSMNEIDFAAWLGSDAPARYFRAVHAADHRNREHDHVHEETMER
jgi:hypothetical protein